MGKHFHRDDPLTVEDGKERPCDVACGTIGAVMASRWLTNRR